MTGDRIDGSEASRSIAALLRSSCAAWSSWLAPAIPDCRAERGLSPSRSSIEGASATDRAKRDASEDQAVAPQTQTLKPRLAWLAPHGPDRVYVILNDGHRVHRLDMHWSALDDLGRQIAELKRGGRGAWPAVDASSGAQLKDPLDAQTGEKLPEQER